MSQTSESRPPLAGGLDRLTRMAARLLGAPAALVTVTAGDAQFVGSAAGLPEPRAGPRGTPLTHPFCRQVAGSGEPLVVEDARRHPLLRSSPGARESGWAAYAGVPLVAERGEVVGTLAVIDPMPRLWSERDVELLQDLAAWAVADIERDALRAGHPLHPHDGPHQGNGRSHDAELLDEAGIALGVASPEGRWVRVNRALCDLLGFREEELLGAPAERLTHPDDRPADREALRLLLAGECAGYTGEKRCVDRSGRPVWTLTTVTLVHDEAGGPHHFVIGLQEIGERVRTEAALRESEERYRLAAEAAGHAAWDWDLPADRIVWGEEVTALFGHAPPGLASDAAWWYERIHPDDRERVVGGIQGALARSERHWELAYRFRRGAGDYAHVASRGTVLLDASGDPARMVGVMVDETPRRRAEAALRAGEARYRSLVDHLRDVVFLTDAQGCWLLLNPAWEALTGREVAASIGRALLDDVHPEDQALHQAGVAALAAGDRESCVQELRLRTRTGDWRWVEMRARLALDEHGAATGITGTLADVTERKRTETTLEECRGTVQRMRDLLHG